MDVKTSDGVRLYYEVTGEGHPILFMHEYSGDYRSWESQVRQLSRRYKCVTYSARGFLPSEVPPDVSSYSQARVVQDALEVLEAVEPTGSAHVVGVSMGGFGALHLAIQHPDRVSAVAVGGCGYGASDTDAFRAESAKTAAYWKDAGAPEAAKAFAVGPFRIPFMNKDPRGWQEWADQLGQHDEVGAANTVVGVQGERPTLVEMEDDLARLPVPLLLVVGDEDDPCLEANLAIKRKCPMAALHVLPRTGHTVNLEEPEAFNRGLSEFFSWVESGRWTPRDPRSIRDHGGWIR
jgi:Predicted hydrolases or acyltransferases (alpha/beta hydrolase superfamily)